MSKVIYAIKINEVSSGDLKIIYVKIGQTTDIYSTLRQYKRGISLAEILDVWEVNQSLKSSECEDGIQIVASRYALKCDKERFAFLQDGDRDSYQEFAKNINLILKNITGKIGKKRGKISSKKDYKKIDSYTGRQPYLLMFKGKEYPIQNWREVLCKVAEEIYNEKKDFTAALKLKGTRRFYFSKEKNNLVDPLEIKNTPYYCEGNLSADQIMRIIKKLLDIFGYSKEDLKVSYK